MSQRRESGNSGSRAASALMILALLLVLVGWPSRPPDPPQQGESTQPSLQPQVSGPVDLTEAHLELERRRHQLTLEFERMTSRNPRLAPLQGRPMDYGVRLESEQILIAELDPSEPADLRSPRHEILRHLKIMQDHEQWRVARNEAFVREVLRRARADGWIVKLDENLQVVEVLRAQPQPYRDSMGSAAR